MYVRLCAALCWLLVPCVPSPAAGGKPTAAAELRWARGVVDHFWEAVVDCDLLAAAGLLSPRLEQEVARHRGELPGQGLMILVGREFCFGNCSASVVSEELAPGGGEAIFKGVLTYRDAVGKASMTADYVMRIAREAPGNKWSIHFLRVKARPEKKK